MPILRPGSGQALQQGTDAAVYLGVAAGGLGDAGEDLEPCPEPCRRKRGLAGAVAADACPECNRRDADDFAALHLEGDVLQGP